MPESDGTLAKIPAAEKLDNQPSGGGGKKKITWNDDAIVKTAILRTASENCGSFSALAVTYVADPHPEQTGPDHDDAYYVDQLQHIVGHGFP